MKTPSELKDEHFVELADTSEELIAAIQSYAFAAGERKGRIEEKRSVADRLKDTPIHKLYPTLRKEADRLEREQQSK